MRSLRAYNRKRLSHFADEEDVNKIDFDGILALWRCC